MKKQFILTLFSTIILSNAKAQEYYGWMDGICEYAGYIRTDLTNQQELDAIYGTLWYANTLSRPVLRNKERDSAFIRMDLVRTECTNYKKELIDADYPAKPVWDSLRKVRLAELNRECALKELAYFAIKNPDTLLSDKESPKAAKKWAKVIAGSDKKILSRYESWLGKAEFAALKTKGWTDKQIVEQAKIDFLQFEWWNSEMETIHAITNFTIVKQEFEKLFTKITMDCD